MIKEYIAYLKDNPQGYWFKAKLYGWGWTPATWQGWTAILVYVALVVFLARKVGTEATEHDVLFSFVIPVVVLTAGLILLSYKKGEKPRWRWGNKK